MAEEKVTTRRKAKTKEEKVEDIDRKIATYENKIEALKAQKEAILNPVTYQSVTQEAKRRKVSPKKLAELLDAQFPVKES